jgi:hypothetical protein
VDLDGQPSYEPLSLGEQAVPVHPHRRYQAPAGRVNDRAAVRLPCNYGMRSHVVGASGFC